VNPEPPDSGIEVQEIREVSSYSDLEEFAGFEPVMEVEPEMDTMVLKKLILRTQGSISIGINRGLKAITGDDGEAFDDCKITDLIGDTKDDKDDL
jgi:hypothetical protein